MDTDEELLPGNDNDNEVLVLNTDKDILWETDDV
jgi:hypothetical protein